MLRALGPVLLVSALSLSACSKPHEANEQPETTSGATEAPPAKSVAADTAEKGGTSIEAVQPRIAYDYQYGFRLPTDAIGSVQDEHVALCDRVGPAACRVVSLERSQTTGSEVLASLKLQVEADKARAFGAALVKSVDGAGGKAVDTSIKATDLSKDMVDTEARIKAKEAVIERLTTILRTRTGSVDQLVSAERAIGDAQQELDSARAWLAEAQSRVAMSTIEIGYSSTGVAGGSLSKVGSAIGDSAELFTTSLGALLRLLVMIAPWAALAGIGLWARLRYLRWRSARDAV